MRQTNQCFLDTNINYYIMKHKSMHVYTSKHLEMNIPSITNKLEFCFLKPHLHSLVEPLNN